MRPFVTGITSAVLALAVALPAHAQARRTAWGDPDLAGTYSNSNESGTLAMPISGIRTAKSLNSEGKCRRTRNHATIETAQIAKYAGHGSTDDAVNFVSAAPKK